MPRFLCVATGLRCKDMATCRFTHDDAAGTTSRVGFSLRAEQLSSTARMQYYGNAFHWECIGSPLLIAVSPPFA